MSKPKTFPEKLGYYVVGPLLLALAIVVLVSLAAKVVVS